MAVRAAGGRHPRDLFERFMGEPETMPEEWQDDLPSDDERRLARRVADYIAGMTDRYAILEHRACLTSRRTCVRRAKDSQGPAALSRSSTMNIFGLFEKRVADALGRLAEAGKIPAGLDVEPRRGRAAARSAPMATSPPTPPWCWPRKRG